MLPDSEGRRRRAPRTRAMRKPVRPAAPKVGWEEQERGDWRRERQSAARGQKKGFPVPELMGPNRGADALLSHQRGALGSPRRASEDGESPRSKFRRLLGNIPSGPRPEGGQPPLAPDPENERGRSLVPPSTRRRNSERQESPLLGGGGALCFLQRPGFIRRRPD